MQNLDTMSAQGLGSKNITLFTHIKTVHLWLRGHVQEVSSAESLAQAMQLWSERCFCTRLASRGLTVFAFDHVICLSQ